MSASGLFAAPFFSHFLLRSLSNNDKPKTVIGLTWVGSDIKAS